MSFFPTKTIVVKVRGIQLIFNVISKADFDRLEYYGKISEAQIKENPELVSLASEEITNLLASKIVTKEDDVGPTAQDLNELTNDELKDIIEKVSGSSESIKQSLNKK